jgi:hypothetical protein
LYIIFSDIVNKKTTNHHFFWGELPVDASFKVVSAMTGRDGFAPALAISKFQSGSCRHCKP